MTEVCKKRWKGGGFEREKTGDLKVRKMYDSSHTYCSSAIEDERNK